MISQQIKKTVHEISWLWMNKEISGNGEVTITDKIYKTTKLKKAYTVEKGIDAALVGLSDDGIIVVFRGTEEFADWLNDFNVLLVNYLKPNYGKVHKGFIDSVVDVRNEVFNYLNQFAQKSKMIYITGHSKGGAMATLFAPLINDAFKSHQIQVVTFAAPRVGDKQYQTSYNQQNIQHVRYEYYKDTIPHVPFSPPERALFPRLGTVFEITDKILLLPLYYSVGTLVTLADRADIYDVHNNTGENLNSFSAAMYDLKNLGNNHINGYLND